jgi:hypothetical protein
MSDAYILEGIEDDYLLVIKAEDQETILSIIDRLSTSRSKWIKELALILEESLHDTGSRRDSSKTRPKDTPKSTNGNKRRRTKTANTKHRSKPRT